VLNLLPPVLYQAVPFSDNDAFLDWSGQHELEHRALAQLTGTAYLPMGDLRQNLVPHDNMHKQVARALGIPPAYDLLGFDLHDRASYGSFMMTNGQDHDRFRQTLGV
jgi:hypothetical protein